MSQPNAHLARHARAGIAPRSRASNGAARLSAGLAFHLRARGLAAVVLALAVAGFPAAPARAADCDGELPQQEMNRCAHEDWQRADHALNVEYKRARAFLQRIERDLPPDLRTGAADLRDAQRAWITFRDKACAAEASLFKGGSMEPFLLYSCMTRLTRQRADDLGFIAE